MQEKNKKKNNNFFISKCIDDTKKIAYDLANNAKPGDIFCLEGDLGVGKTVIAKGIGNFFNVKEEITSPTFTILKTYNTKDKIIKTINHFDLYRIKDKNELINIGFDEYIYDKNSISIIEWPEVALELLPNNIKIIRITKLENKDQFYREINLIYE
jgi:tRNA threonylcarbamoyladenosine biosynthesis protein TsaE